MSRKSCNKRRTIKKKHRYKKKHTYKKKHSIKSKNKIHLRGGGALSFLKKKFWGNRHAAANTQDDPADGNNMFMNVLNYKKSDILVFFDYFFKYDDDFHDYFDIMDVYEKDTDPVTITFNNGDTYKGYYKKNTETPHGKGVYTFSDGETVFIGSWKDGSKDGFWFYRTFRNNMGEELFKQQFKNGQQIGNIKRYVYDPTTREYLINYDNDNELFKNKKMRLDNPNKNNA